MRPHPSRPATRATSGFTLVELVIASSLLAVLLLAGAATASLVRRAAINAVSESAMSLTAALHDLRRDAGMATGVGYLGASRIVLTVPDRNADGVSETIEYSWAGIAGEPLLRRTNGGAWSTVAPGLTQFRLDWSTVETQTTVTTSPAVPTESLMASCVTTSGLKNYNIKDNASHAVSTVAPSVPASQTWTLTRVRLNLRSKGSAIGSFSVQVRPTNAGVPTSVVLAESVISESSLTSSYTWRSIPFSPVGSLKGTAPIAIVIKWLSDSDACEFQGTGSAGAIPPTSTFAKSDDGLVTWSLDTSNTMLFEVYGYVNPSNQTTVQRTELETLSIAARDQRSMSLSTFVNLTNRPICSGLIEVP